MEMLAMRDDMRERREFGPADEILDELLAMDIRVDDARRQRLWWVGRRADGREERADGPGAGGGRRKWFNEARTEDDDGYGDDYGM